MRTVFVFLFAFCISCCNKYKPVGNRLVIGTIDSGTGGNMTWAETDSTITWFIDTTKKSSSPKKPSEEFIRYDFSKDFIWSTNNVRRIDSAASIILPNGNRLLNVSEMTTFSGVISLSDRHRLDSTIRLLDTSLRKSK